MEKVYLTLISLQGKYYITLAPNDQGQMCLSAKDTAQEIIDSFNNFRDKAMNPGLENHVSGSLGIINLSPHVIEMPKDNPELLSKYIINMKPMKIKGSVHGAFVNFDGVEVSKDILELSVCDIANKIVKQVYS